MPKNLSRYEHNGIEGWLVRVYHNGDTFSKLFTDKKHGSRLKSKNRAIVWRDLKKKQLREQQEQEKRFIASSQRNSSGVIGVSRIEKTERSGETYAHWQASWREDNRTKTRTFSVEKYGEDEARWRAVKARHEAMVALHGERYIEERKHNDLMPSDEELFNS